MQLRRHVPPLQEWKLPALVELSGARRWGLALAGAIVAGYLTAYLVLFPAAILHGHEVVPRVLGLSLQEASAALRKAGLQVQDGGSESHPTAPQGTIVWQDPPPDVSAPTGLRVTLVSSDGPPKIPVPHVTGLDGPLAQPGLLGLSQADARTRLEQQGLALGTVTRRRSGEGTPGTVIAQRPAAGTLAAPGTVVDVVVARSP